MVLLVVVVLFALATSLAKPLWQRVWAFFALDTCLEAGGHYNDRLARCEFSVSEPSSEPRSKRDTGGSI